MTSTTVARANEVKKSLRHDTVRLVSDAKRSITANGNLPASKHTPLLDRAEAVRQAMLRTG